MSGPYDNIFGGYNSGLKLNLGVPYNPWQPIGGSNLVSNFQTGHYVSPTAGSASTTATTAKSKGFDWGGLAGGVVGLLGGGLLGGGGDNSEVNAARAQQNAALLGYQHTTRNWDDLANSNLGSAQQWGLQADQATQNLADYYRTDPYTSQRDAQDLAPIVNRQSAAFDQAMANTRLAMANNGLDTIDSSGQSSAGAGANAYLQAMKANAIGGAQNDLAYRKIAARQNNAMSLVDLLNGTRDSAYSKGASALGNAANGYSGLAEQYGNLANYLQSLQSQQQGNLLNGAAGIASAFA